MDNRCDALADPENELDGDNGQNRVGNIYIYNSSHASNFKVTSAASTIKFGSMWSRVVVTLWSTKCSNTLVCPYLTLLETYIASCCTVAGFNIT